MTDQWKRIADLPSGRKGAITFSVNGKGYLGSGILYNHERDLIDLWEYDPANDIWTQKADLPASRTYGISFVVNGRVFAGFGMDKNIFEYLPETDTWKFITQFPGTSVFNASTFVIDETVYVGMGSNGGGKAMNEWWTFSLSSNEWIQKNDFPGSYRADAIAYAIYGMGYYGAGHRSYDVWKYNPKEDFWAPTGPINTKWTGSTYYFSIGGKGYVGSTYSGHRDSASFLRYNE